MMNCLIKLKPRTIGHLTVVLTFLIIAGCGSSSNPTDDSASEVKTDTETVTESSSDSDMISDSGSLEGKAIAELPSPTVTTPSSPATSQLVKNTQAEARIAQLEVGRYDPFSGVVARRQPPAPAAPQPAPAAPSPSPTAPTEQPSALPQPTATQPAPIPVVAANPVNPTQAAGTLPSVLVPSQSTPAEATPIASRIEISGVVQVDNRTVVIVSVPNEATSRYVGEGEMLANGQVRVKRIEAAPNQEPLVILEQNGQEFSRTVGSSSSSLS